MTAMVRIPLWLGSVALCVAAARGSDAATPVAVSASPDIAVVLGSNAQLVIANDVAVDQQDGTVGLAPVGTLPVESNVSGYDLLPGGDQLLCFDTTVVLPGPVF